MRWDEQPRSKRSGNLIDRRGRSGGGRGSAGIPLGIGGTLILIVLSLVFGTDLFALLGMGPQAGTAPAPAASSAAEQELVDFMAFLIGDTQDTWAEIFDASAIPYRDAQMVLYRGGTGSGCGYAQSAVGPFYCPTDGNVYLDLSFYRTLRDRLGAPGDFAQAYVVAHEVGHHVQNLLGTLSEVEAAKRSNPANANRLSVQLELQADCYAGVWGASARDLLEPGDLEEGLRAAAAVGDDTLSSGRVRPDSFTHGSSAERVQWFRRGLDSGDPSRCDTFAAAGL